jgi:hypothetical protein
MKRELACGLLLFVMGAFSPLRASVEPVPIAAAMTSPPGICQLPADPEALPVPAAEPAKKVKAPAADAHNLLLLLLLNVSQGISSR